MPLSVSLFVCLLCLSLFLLCLSLSLSVSSLFSLCLLQPDDDPLNSDDDADSDEDNVWETDNTIVCQFEKVIISLTRPRRYKYVRNT